MKKLLIKSLVGVFVVGSLGLTLTGCGKEVKKDIAKDIQNQVNEVNQVITNSAVNNTAVNNSTVNNTGLQNNDYQGLYITEEQTGNYVHNVTLLIQNYTKDYIDFAINASNSSSVKNVNIGHISGRANKKSDSVYVFSENPFNTGVCTITFKFNENKEVTIEESYPNDINPYGGNKVYFAGTHKKSTNNGIMVMDEMSNIYYKASQVKEEFFIKLWENTSDGTELALNKDGTFVIDHYTKSSEVRGKYVIDGTKIICTNNDGTKWQGEILMEQAGNKTLKINYNGEEIYLLDGEGD